MYNPNQLFDDAFTEYARSTVSQPAVDMHEAIANGALPTGTDKSLVNPSLLSTNWLPFAAESYNISPKLDDYVIVPVTIFLTNIPNTNMCAFSTDEMTKWNVKAGAISYQTWKCKPTHVEHANKDPSIAHGVILDSVMRPAPEYAGNLNRVVLLSAWDRNRDPELASRILKGKTGFSMGAWVDDYECTACGSSMRRTGCEHMNAKQGITKRMEGNKLVYRLSRGVMGFELSSVGNPSWKGAVASPLLEQGR